MKRMKRKEEEEEDGFALSGPFYASLLRFCLPPAALSHGRRLHAHLARHGRLRDPRLASSLLAMYACRSSSSSGSAALQEARALFDRIPCPDGPAWTSLILAYARQRAYQEVLRLFSRMHVEGPKPGRFAFLPALSASARLSDLAQGKLVHSHIAACGPLLTSDAALHTSVLTMYAKCGSIDAARRVFNQQGIADQVTWNAMISAYAQNGHDEDAIGLLRGMCLVAGEEPDRATFLGLLSPCNDNSLTSSAVTRVKHALIISAGFDLDMPVRTALFNLYATCGSLTDARAVFDGMPARDMVSWNAIIAAYARNGLFQEALELLRHMASQGVNPDRGIFLCLLNACSCIEDGTAIRERIVAHNLESDTVVSTALLGMYAKCGCISDAREIFDGMRWRDRVSWNAMLTAYAQNRQAGEALGLLREMDIEGLKPDKDLFLLVVNTCTGSPSFADKDRILQELAARFGFRSETTVMTALVGMYAAHGELGDARTVFNGIQCHNQASWNSMIAAYARNGHGKEALKCFRQMRSEGGIEPNAGSFLSLLSGRTDRIPAMHAREVQELIFVHGFNLDVCVMTALLGVYAECGSLREARCIFDAMSERDVVTWNAMLSGYARRGCAKEVLMLFREMESREGGWGVKPNKVSFLCLVRACASLVSLEDGKAIHEQIRACGLGSDITLNTALIDMYSKCGSLRDAQSIFDGLHEHDTISMSVMSAAYVRSGRSSEAIKLLGQMELRGLKLDKAAYLCLLGACARVGSLENARDAHRSILAAGTAGGFDTADITVNNSLMSMYGKCGSPKEAWSVFDRMCDRDDVSWSTMVSAYMRNGHSPEALELFGQMLSEGGKVYGAAAKTALLHMYGKCGRLNEAQSIFDGLSGSERDAIAWSALLAAYVQNDRRQEAVDLFHKMELEEGMTHNKITFVSALSACASPPFFETGRMIHSRVTACGLESDVTVANALINMYGKCGCLEEAELVFDHMIERDVISWNAMLTACIQNGHSKRALDFFERMSLHSVKPNEVTFVGLLNACARLGYLGAGQAIHEYICVGGLESNAIVSTALLSMYGKCGKVEAARTVFNGMCGRDRVAWNAMLAAYARNGHDKKVLGLFACMSLEGGVEPDGVTFLCLLQSCAALSSLDNGRVIHEYMASSTIAHGPLLGNATTNALINMYGKCGSLEDAQSIFFNCSHNTVAWTAMLVAYARNGQGEKALGLAQQMRSYGIEPDAVTFLCALSACSHSGLREEGWQYLVSMRDDYAATPLLTHYLCINDLLGRTGCFNEVHDMTNVFSSCVEFGGFIHSYYVCDE